MTGNLAPAGRKTGAILVSINCLFAEGKKAIVMVRNEDGGNWGEMLIWEMGVGSFKCPMSHVPL